MVKKCLKLNKTREKLLKINENWFETLKKFGINFINLYEKCMKKNVANRRKLSKTSGWKMLKIHQKSRRNVENQIKIHQHYRKNSVYFLLSWKNTRSLSKFQHKNAKSIHNYPI